MSFELSLEYAERLQEAIEANDAAFVVKSMDGVNPADISALLEEFEAEECKFVLDSLPTELGAEVLGYVDEDDRSRFLKQFSPRELAGYVGHLDSDDAVDVVNDLPIKEREEVIAQVDDAEQAQHIMELMRYEEDVAGGLMAKEYITANMNWTVTEAIAEIRRQRENVEKIYSIYVVDNTEKLLGRVSLKTIILSDDDTRVADIYDEEVISVETYNSEEEVAEIMAKYDLDAIPVVNVKGKLVGRITIDDVVDVIRDQAEEERQLMSGISEDVEEDDSVWMLSRARLPWLMIGMSGGLLGAQFIGLFEKDIALIPAMSFFIPLITATGGNVGIQSSSIVLQSLANRSVFGEALGRRIFRALLVALLNGIILSGSVLLLNYFLMDSTRLALVVSIALFSVVLLASFMGTITPLVLDRFGINPALASGPFITTANDLLGLGVYFMVAHLLYQL